MVDEDIVVRLEKRLDANDKPYFIGRIRSPIDIACKDGVVFLLFISEEGNEEMHIKGYAPKKKMAMARGRTMDDTFASLWNLSETIASKQYAGKETVCILAELTEVVRRVWRKQSSNERVRGTSPQTTNWFDALFRLASLGEDGCQCLRGIEG